MKNLIKHGSIRYAFMLLLLMFTQAVVWAQDSTSTATSTTKTTTSTTETTQQDWYAQPWVWVVGGAVFLLLIVALVRGNSSSTTSRTTDKVTITKQTTDSV